MKYRAIGYVGSLFGLRPATISAYFPDSPTSFAATSITKAYAVTGFYFRQPGCIQLQNGTSRRQHRGCRISGRQPDSGRRQPVHTVYGGAHLFKADSAAKMGRDRETQAVLPLRGKILNVASATQDKMKANQEISDITLALGCGLRHQFDLDKLRYERVVIMTDADVDGAHIAALLMTFFYREMPGLIESGHLYLAQPPLYRLSQGGQTAYARDDKHKDELLKKQFKSRGKVEISRFKGLGEMPARQLKETTMNQAERTLLRVTLTDAKAAAEEATAQKKETESLVERLMGRKPELRFAFIQENTQIFFTAPNCNGKLQNGYGLV